jgi:hypothetical protein
MKKNKVLLIGWDAADWKIIDKLMDNGLMPAMKKLVDGGVRGKLATLDPPLSPMLWTSIATGVRPYKHGVSGFVEHDGKGNVRPVSSHYRKVKAIWNMMPTASASITVGAKQHFSTPARTLVTQHCKSHRITHHTVVHVTQYAPQTSRPSFIRAQRTQVCDIAVHVLTSCSLLTQTNARFNKTFMHMHIYTNTTTSSSTSSSLPAAHMPAARIFSRGTNRIRHAGC